MSMDVIQGDVLRWYGGKTVVSGAASTVIAGPFDLLRYKDKSFSLYNYGATTLSGAVIQVNPDHSGIAVDQDVPLNDTAADRPTINETMWHDFDTTSFRSMGSGDARSVAAQSNAIFRWWRIVGTVDNAGLANATVSGWMYARTV